MLDTGMRSEEVCRMSWENVHLGPVNGARFGYLHNPKGKTKHAKRNLSLTSRVHSLLTMRHTAAGKPAAGWVFPRQKAEYPIMPFRLYDLRHTFLTHLGEVNTDPFTIQRIAGHSSITMSQRYVHRTPERLEDAFARLETYNQMKVAATSDPAAWQ
jgi:integrase